VISSRDESIVVVVSGAGSGLGRALAIALAQQGARLALCGRTGERLAETAELASSAGASVVMWHAFDIADVSGACNFADEVGARFGRIDGLINNAGILGEVGPITTVELDRWAEGLRTNVTGTATMTATFAPLLQTSRPGSIVNLSGAGIGGPSAPERVSSYVVSKAAIVALTEVLARELAPVRVNVVAPGAVDTGFNNAVLDAGESVAGSRLTASVKAQIAAPFPTKPFLDLVLWLLSEDSSWITGRLLSARWETPAALRANRPAIERSDLYRLRRIDGVMFESVEEAER